jgi:hypothetical protein
MGCKRVVHAREVTAGHAQESRRGSVPTATQGVGGKGGHACGVRAQEAAAPVRRQRRGETGGEREFCLLKGIAEGTYNTKHAEAARLYYAALAARGCAAPASCMCGRSERR